MLHAERIGRLRRERRRLRTAAHQRVGAALAALVLLTCAFGAVTLAVGVSVVLSLAAPYAQTASAVQPPDQMLAGLSHGGARIYDRHGALLYQFVDPNLGMRHPIALSAISPWLLKATIAVEDPTFYSNAGVNVRGLARAAYENFSPWASAGLLQGSGGSSITQQLVKNIYIPAAERAQRSVDRKAREVAIAVELTTRYSKDDILGWYLNSISYGGIYTGAQAAAQGYFGVPAANLTLGEAALLAGLPQSPTAYDPVQHPDAALARREEVLRLMVEHGAVTSAQAAEAATEPLVLRPQRFDVQAPQFVFGPVLDALTRQFGEQAVYNGGLAVTTTLDLPLQQQGERILDQVISEHEEATNSHNGALIAVDPHTGEVLAYVGSRNYWDDSILGRNDNVQSLRSPGSTLKPFTYLTAFEKGWGTGTGIPDVPFTWIDPVSKEPFTPKDPAHSMGIATAAQALGNSSNVAAVHTILFAGVDQTINTLQAVGYTTFGDRSNFGPALTVGGSDVTLADQVMAYSVLANQGLMVGRPSPIERPAGERTIDSVVLLDVTDAQGRVLYHFNGPVTQRVEPAAATYLVTSILSNGKNTCVTWWCGALVLGNGMPAAVKTGTSEPYVGSHDEGDTWAVGYTTELVTGVWAGNSDNTPAHDIYSTTIAWATWNQFMIAAHDVLGLQGQPFERPAGVVDHVVCWPSGNIATAACPADHRYTSMFMADVKPSVDTWWRAQGGGASVTLPADFSGASPRQLVGYVTPGLRANERVLGAGLAGPAALAVSFPSYAATAILSPADGATVNGIVSITGSAVSPGMVRYGIDVTSGAYQAVLATGQTAKVGLLTSWDTRSAPNGVYTVRLMVVDSSAGTALAVTQVTVKN